MPKSIRGLEAEESLRLEGLAEMAVAREYLGGTPLLWHPIFDQNTGPRPIIARFD